MTFDKTKVLHMVSQHSVLKFTFKTLKNRYNANEDLALKDLFYDHIVTNANLRDKYRATATATAS